MIGAGLAAAREPRTVLSGHLGSGMLADVPVDGWQDGSPWWPESTAGAIRIETECAWSFYITAGQV